MLGERVRAAGEIGQREVRRLLRGQRLGPLARGPAQERGTLGDVHRHRAIERGGELAPHDFTIRRGTMPMRGIDPMGPQFREMLQGWVGGGQPYYRPLPDTAGKQN